MARQFMLDIKYGRKDMSRAPDWVSEDERLERNP